MLAVGRKDLLSWSVLQQNWRSLQPLKKRVIRIVNNFLDPSNCLGLRLFLLEFLFCQINQRDKLPMFSYLLLCQHTVVWSTAANWHDFYFYRGGHILSKLYITHLLWLATFCYYYPYPSWSSKSVFSFSHTTYQFWCHLRLINADTEEPFCIARCDKRFHFIISRHWNLTNAWHMSVCVRHFNKMSYIFNLLLVHFGFNCELYHLIKSAVFVLRMKFK